MVMILLAIFVIFSTRKPVCVQKLTSTHMHSHRQEYAHTECAQACMHMDISDQLWYLHTCMHTIRATFFLYSTQAHKIYIS